jgi:Chemotaxis response regulator containing a CheY-like receiver domain and a methylesterase domain
LRKTKVLVVDDSAAVRQTLARIIEDSGDLELSDIAPDPFVAVEKIAQELPDVIVLDIEMPRMDGLSFLREIMSQHPIPTVICSSLAIEGSDSIMKAFAYGAVDVITKPRLGTRQFLEESSILICDTIRAASRVRVKRVPRERGLEPEGKLTADAVIPMSKKRVLTETTEKVVVVGASTGGTEALRVFLEAMPDDAAGIVVVQHMPENFTRSFAQRLDSLCRISVKEAGNGDAVLRGRALIAPGNYHTLLRRSGASYFVEVKEGPLVSRHRPSVDVLFRSSALNAGKNAVAVIMTGMGDDGAKGMLELKESGALTIAQDEESCVVFGMPKEAIRLGAADHVLPLDRIATFVYAKSLGK